MTTTTTEYEFLFPAEVAGFQFDVYDTFGTIVHTGKLGTLLVEGGESVSTGAIVIPTYYRSLTARISGLVGTTCTGTPVGPPVHSSYEGP